jgi:hypothetical protein
MFSRLESKQVQISDLVSPCIYYADIGLLIRPRFQRQATWIMRKPRE